jgi:hypothetical protein
MTDRPTIVEIEKPYRLRTLESLIKDGCETSNAKKRYQPIPVEMLRELKVGSMVRLCIEATQFPEPCAESAWFIISKVRGGSFVGHCNSRMKRTQFHGVAYDTILEFSRKHVTDIWVNVQKTKVALGDNLVS